MKLAGRVLRIAALAGAVAASATSAQRPPAVILGTVTDTGLRPVGSAEVSIVLSSVRVSADANGRFQIVNVPTGNYLLVVRRIGFRPTSSAVEVRSGDTLRLAFMLEPSIQELDAVRVAEKSQSVRLQEFDERRTKGEGEFFTQEQIDARNAGAAADIIRQAKGVRVAVEGAGQLVALSARQFTRCPMQVYVDGIPIAGVGPNPGAPFDLGMLPSPKSLAGIEIYSGAATIPLQLNLPNGPPSGKQSCGVVLVWTRDGSRH